MSYIAPPPMTKSPPSFRHTRSFRCQQDRTAISIHNLQPATYRYWSRSPCCDHYDHRVHWDSCLQKTRWVKLLLNSFRSLFSADFLANTRIVAPTRTGPINKIRKEKIGDASVTMVFYNILLSPKYERLLFRWSVFGILQIVGSSLCVSTFTV